jgi:gliding motility-associated-like protein
MVNISLGQANDCATATTICSNPPAMGNPSGNGGYDDFSDPDNDPGCLSSEGNTAWYYFEIDPGAPSGLELGFTIIPDGGYGEDYDWALFGPDVDCGDLGSPIRCSSASSACGFCPETGMGMGTSDYSEGPGFGDGFVATLDVAGGQGFYIAINNWYGTGNGFSLEFTGSAAPWLDCTADPPCSVIAVASNDVTICEGGPPFAIEVFPDGGLPPYTYLWEGTGDGTDYLSDPTVQSPIVTLPSGVDGTITYYVTVSDGICEAIDSLDVLILPGPDITIFPIGPLCTNDVNTFLAMGIPQNGTWGGIANTIGEIVPANFSQGIHYLTLSTVTAEGCPGIDSIPVEFFDPEPITITPVDPLCESSPPFVIQVNPPGGTWTGDVDPSGTIYPDLLGSGTFIATYQYTSIYGCESSELVIFDIFEDPEPLILDPGLLCLDQNTVQLEADPTNGLWGGVANSLGAVFPSVLGLGTHQVTYTYSDANGCTGKDSIQLEIIEPPYADLEPAGTVCNSDAGGQSTLFDFNGLILGGDAGGIWLDYDNSGATGSFPVLDFNGIPPGVYTFQYTTLSAQGACQEYQGFVQIIVEDCQCPSIALDPSTDWCNDGSSLDLNTLKITSELGTWQILSSPPGTNPATINASTFISSGKDSGLYTIQFTLSTPPPPGCPSTNTLVVNLYSTPIALLPVSVQVCNQSGTGNFPHILDLYALITGGDAGGQWVNVNGVNAGGPFTALNFVGVAPGSYNFQYTTNSATAPCQESTYSLQIVVEDCSCPSLAFNPPPSLCNDGSPFDLNSLLVTAESGSWSLTSAPPGSNPATLAGTLFQPLNRDAGTYIIRFSLSMPPPVGCPLFAEATLNLLPAPFAVLQSQLSVCNSNTSGQDPTTLDFGDFITSGDAGGTWVDVTSSGATGTFPLLDFTGILPGLYAFSYSTNAASLPCTEKTYQVNVLVKNCLCPDLDILSTSDYCNSMSTLDLTSLILQAAPGSWSLTSMPPGTNPVLLNGNMINTLQKDAGAYTLTYTLLTPPPAGCPDAATSMINLYDQPATGLALAPTAFCEGTVQLQGLGNLLNGADAGGSWTFLTGPSAPGSSFDPNAGTLAIQTLVPGAYGFQYGISAQAPCTNVTTDVSVIIHPNPIANAGAGQSISCLNPTVTLGQGQTPPSTYTLSWIGPGLPASNLANPVINTPGVFILTVLEIQTGCSSADTVVVSGSNDLITGLQVDEKGASCPGITDGFIEAILVTGGTPPFLYSLNGSLPQPTPLFDALTSGPYTLQVTDAIGCSRDTTITLQAGSGFTLDLGPDWNVIAGTPVAIQATLYPGTTTLTSLIWNPIHPDGCTTCTGFAITAVQDVTYSLIATDVNGCQASDEVTIRVTLPKRVYIPTAFSPNGDGLNDLFYVHGGPEVLRVKSIQVFDRWGNAIYRKDDILPNDHTVAWDGTFRGRFVGQEVYVYSAEIEFVDGSSRLYKGDVLVSSSLIR